MSEVVNLIQGVRDIREHSQIKDYLRDNPDWAESPDKMTQVLSISPTLGAGLIDRSKAIADQRSARAGQRLVFLQKADDDAHAAYTKALERGAPGSDEGEAGEGGMAYAQGLGANYAAADKAGNDVYQNYRLQAQDLYGSGFADKLPQVWKLDEYGQRRPSYERMLDSMREPVNLVFPDGKATTTTLLPHELSRLTRENPGIRITKLGSGADVPGAATLLSDEEATQRGLPGAGAGAKYQRDAKGAITAVVGPEVVQKAQESQRNAFLTQGGGAEYAKSETAFKNIKDALKTANGVGDLKALVFQAQLENPQMGVTDGNVAMMGQQNQLPPNVQIWFNRLLASGGQFSPETRREISASIDETLGRQREKHGPMRALMQSVEKAQGWAPGTIVGGTPYMSEEEFGKYKAPLPSAPGKAPPPAVSAANRQAAQARLNAVTDPATLPEAHVKALQGLTDAQLRAVDPAALTTDQLKRLLDEQKRRGWQ